MRRHLIAILSVLLLCPAAWGDTFQLRSGGRVRGELLNPVQKPRVAYSIRLDGGGDVTLDAKDVKVHRRGVPQEFEYRKLLQRMPSDSAENHWKMAEQCRKWSLPHRRKFHLEQVIRLDPDHADARRLLKYKRGPDGKWTTSAELQAAAGLIREGGRLMSPQQAQIEAAAEHKKNLKIEWKKKLRMWRTWLRDPRRRSQALKAIRSIKDPAAADSLASMFWSEKNVELQEMLAELLGRLNSGTATLALAKAAMEADTEMRLYCVRQLKENNRHSIANSFIPELRSKDNKRVRRAAYALGELGNDAAVLPLIKALSTQHKFKLGDGSNGKMNASFDPTGQSGGGLSMGKKKDRIVNRPINNKEVRNALSKLTDLDFEYSESRWLTWYRLKTTPPQLDLRRDP